MALMIYTLYGFAIIFIIIWCCLWLIHLAAIIYGKYRLHRKVAILPSDIPYSGVSIIKPLMGVDPFLFENLETFFTIKYPKYELLFCIEDSTDPSVMVVKSLMEKYLNVDARIFIGASTVGVNPKINNMNDAYESAIYDFVLISDCNIHINEDTLNDMMDYMTDDTALVHQVPFSADRTGFAATLEKIYFGTAQSRIYLVADFLGFNCHTGMSALIRKSVLDEEGGLKRFGCYLAEDFFISKSVLERGWKTRICSQPAMQNSGACTINGLQARLTRWAKLRVAMLPMVLFFEPLTECMVLGGCGAWAVGFLFQWDSWAFYLIHVLLWFLSDWVLLSVVQNGDPPFNKFNFVVGWVFRECLGPYLFINAVFGPTVKWRSRVYKLAWGGIAEEVKPQIKF